MAVLDGEKFSKMLFRKCSENCDYGYTVIYKLYTMGYFQHDCSTNSYINSIIATEENSLKFFSFSKLDYNILYVLLNSKI